MEAAFSLPQCVGYVALVLGVTAFLQKSDRQLKIIGVFQCIVYAIHFVLLGNLAAAAGNAVSIARNLLSLKTRSMAVAYALAVVVIVLGVFTIETPAGLLPIVATIVAIFGMFRLDGVPFRVTMLLCTFMWIANNVLCHSIGGIVLESLIATANAFTISRLIAESRVVPAEIG